MTIELQAHGMRYQLWLVRVANDGRSIVQHKALPLHVAEVVAAGNPAITAELKERGWVKVPVESKTMAEAGAELVHAASVLLRDADDRRLNLTIRNRLREAINTYTDNVAPPEDETTGTDSALELLHAAGETLHWLRQTDADRHISGLKLRASRLENAIAKVIGTKIIFPAGSEVLFDRAVLPDELDEDPELDADETDRQLYAIKSHQMDTKRMLHEAQTVLADVAEIAFTRAADASAAVLEIQGRLRSHEPRPEGALDLSLAGNLRALLVCLDPDAATNLVEPFAVLERITVLVSELEARAADAEQSLSSATEQLGKETLARVSADKARHEMQDELGRVASVLIIARHTPAGVEDTAAQVRKLAEKLQEYDNEREAARRMVHAAVDLLPLYLGNTPIALSHHGTVLNDAIHDWLDLQPAGEATSATAQFIEKRMGIRDSAPIDLPSPKVVAADPEHGWDFNTFGDIGTAHRAGGVTAAEFVEGVRKLPKPPSLPTDGYGNLLGTEETMGTKVVNAAMWALGKLFPKT